MNSAGLLIIHSARREDTGRYTCTVTTYSGYTVTSSVEVHINSQSTPIRISPLQLNNLVVQGTEFSIACDATGIPTPRVKWTKLHESFDSNVQQLGNVLRITNAQMSNRGVYVCLAENDDGVSDQSSTIIEIDRK